MLAQFSSYLSRPLLLLLFQFIIYLFIFCGQPRGVGVGGGGCEIREKEEVGATKRTGCIVGG